MQSGDDRFGSDTHEEDGNTINPFGAANAYDFEPLVQDGYVSRVWLL
jgi:hypothetical protein